MASCEPSTLYIRQSAVKDRGYAELPRMPKRRSSQNSSYEHFIDGTSANRPLPEASSYLCTQLHPRPQKHPKTSSCWRGASAQSEHFQNSQNNIKSRLTRNCPLANTPS